MSEHIDVGGPAFPAGNGIDRYSGMSLRDWFAGQAMAGILAGDDPKHAQCYDECDEMQQRAGLAYDLADAMLAQRTR